MDPSYETRPILIVDDDPDVGVLMKHLFRESQISNPLRILPDATRAMTLLTESLHGPASEFPLLMLIDLKMPGVSGFELLAWLQERSAFNSVPRLVLSSSLDDRDVTRAHELGATGFLNKFPSPAAFAAIARFAASDPQHSSELADRFPELEVR